jgi:triosephosphate isomerase (TIM)
MARIPLIAGNWKMNLNHLEAIALVQKLAFALPEKYYDRVEVAVLPPFTDVRSVQTLIHGDRLKMVHGAQDLSPHDSGAYTGDISGAFLKALDVRYVIVGHSERRSLHGETDEVVRAKVQAAVRHGLVPVLCVGETAEDLERHGASAVPVAQLRAALTGLPADAPLVVAYEPVWAIGSGKAATSDQAQQVCSALRSTLAELRNEVAESTRILYGGSVKAANIAGFLGENDVDGALVGGASLDVTEFAGIVRFEEHLRR